MDTLDKLKYTVVFIVGIVVGLLIGYVLLIYGIDAIGQSFYTSTPIVLMVVGI